MELVYLWVENYKNIRNQEFNFSPRFECEFDGENLTITENKDYVSIFPDNINVTAIVGENGSGKSSITELLIEFSYQEFHDKKTFLVFFDGNTFLFKQSNTKDKLNFNVINKTSFSNDSKNKSRTIDCIYFSNEIASFFNNPKFHNRQVYSNLDAYYNYHTNLMENNNYLQITREKKNNLETFNTRFHSILQEDKQILTNISENLIFDSFKRELHFYEIGAYFAGDTDFLHLLNKEKLEGYTIFSDDVNKDTNFYKMIILFRWFELKDNRKDVVKKIKDDFNSDDFDLKKCLKILKEFDKFDTNKNIYTKENIEDIVVKFTYSNNEVWVEKEFINIQDNFTTQNKLLNILFKSEICRINFINKLSPEYNYFALSAGEREYIKFFVTLIYHLKSVNEQFIFIFDEIELALHPNWQKKIIKNFINIVDKNIKKNMNFIFTSHSPFILSDIPKENVIFLEKYHKEDKEVKNKNQKEGNCKNATKDIKLKTFGANIHTLLSDGFFMSDGLMGEFAKSKITKILRFLNADNKFIDISQNTKIPFLLPKDYLAKKLKPIIESIGEDFLRNKLLDLYYKKFTEDKKEKEKLILKNKIDELQRQYDELDK
ncbi:ATP-binding protein [Aliarcobacter butzleri]|uniref:ATP-binding protein n=1 Tax=Aliarcobacter butzleri TaxID=28197 RepID=UPI0021B42567|nr:ATP-binding protein [Aliarcobacter butzleri]MCT7591261.1 ATP-binding protein [Aliarcobacter butzleri]